MYTLHCDYSVFEGTFEAHKAEGRLEKTEGHKTQVATYQVLVFPGRLGRQDHRLWQHWCKIIVFPRVAHGLQLVCGCVEMEGGRGVRKRVWMMVRVKVWGCLTACMKHALRCATAQQVHVHLVLVVVKCWGGFDECGGHGEMVRQATRFGLAGFRISGYGAEEHEQSTHPGQKTKHL